ncbi:MAG: CARDB domain-containing protein [Solirubrobacterales bacterium]
MPDRQRQIMARRAIGVGVLVLVLILVVLGVRGCLNARKQRSYENYASDLTAIATQSNQLSKEFFGRLSDPGNLTPLSFEAQIAADRGTAEGLDARVHALDTPGGLDDAQNQLNQAFDLRRDALTGISNQMKAAVGDPGPQRNAAVRSISGYMQYFLASDVLYRLAEGQINAELDNQGISATVPDSVFMTDPQRWLDPLQVSTALAQVSAGKATSGSHGLALLQTTVKPGNTTLDPNTPATISGTGRPELEAQVQNQGSADESAVAVDFQLTGGAETITGTSTIPRLTAGSIQTASIPVKPPPEKNTQLTLEVTVEPVPGERITNNNRLTYTVTFR